MTGSVDAPFTPPERWFWSLPLLVLLAWFPIAPYWASDDFFALHWAKDFEHVLADFHGPWYGAKDLFFFYRPLITLSLWLELQVAGSDPFLAHLDNVLVHAASALLVALLWRRWLSNTFAFAAGLVFGLSPIHIGAIGWAIARTDGFSCALALLSTLLLVRHLEGRQRTRTGSLVAFGLALLCKETVLCLPGLLFVIAFVLANTEALPQRTKSALRAIWPHAVLLGIYLGWRLLLLGRLGGYEAAVYQPLAMAKGLFDYTLSLLNPLHWSPPFGDATASEDWRAVVDRALQRYHLAWLGLLPFALAIVRCLRQRRAFALAAMAAWFLLASVPMAGFFAQSDNAHNLRYFCLAFAGLSGVLVIGGRIAVAIALCSAAAVLVRVRVEQFTADSQSRAMHGKLVSQLGERDLPGPWFVAGLPHQSPYGVALQLHFGIDRLLLP
ncbi:MAG: glycosyltransferase family 39 protein, partial [Planctomycetota bacterium]